MALYKDKDFNGDVVNIDDNTYENCNFRNCTIIYSGGQLPRLTGIVITECIFAFDGAAQRTLQFLSMLGHFGDPEVVKMIFDSILSKDAGKDSK